MLILAAGICSAANKGRAFPSSLSPEQELPQVSPAQSPQHRVAKILPIAHMVLWKVIFKPTLLVSLVMESQRQPEKREVGFPSKRSF